MLPTKLTRDTFTGPWAGLPVAWTADDRFDEATYRDDVAACCRAGIPGVYTGGTTGEFYAMELDEFRAVAEATIDVCHAHGRFAMIGCTSTYTRGAVRRAEIACELGANAVQLALPFWMDVGSAGIVPFFRDVAAAIGETPLSLYETPRAKRTLTLDEHKALQDAVPNYAMVKANAGTLGATPAGCAELAKLVNVFVGEPRWTELGPCGIRGSCSALVYWNPRFALEFWDQVKRRDWDAVRRTHGRAQPLFDFLHAEFGPRGFTDTAFDRLGGVACGFLKTSLRNRGPYPSATPGDVQRLREWCRIHLPEMLASGV